MPDPNGDRASRWVGLVKGLTLGNVLIIFLLVVIAVPVYVIYKALGDEKLLDRLMSTYEEMPDQSGCVVRHVALRGGPDQWGISSGFAVQGSARWFVSVIMDRAPTHEEVESYCEALKLIVDQMRADRGAHDDNPAQ